MILVDTNIPLRIAQVGHPHRQPALDALDLLTLRDRESFAISPQSLYEMYVVCTRPISSNGFGYTPQEAANEIAATRAVFSFSTEPLQIYPVWEVLVVKHAVHGKQAHDARLVAFMIQHSITKILTFNDADFRRYDEIQTLNPFDVLAIPRI